MSRAPITNPAWLHDVWQTTECAEETSAKVFERGGTRTRLWPGRRHRRSPRRLQRTDVEVVTGNTTCGEYLFTHLLKTSVSPRQKYVGLPGRNSKGRERSDGGRGRSLSSLSQPHQTRRYIPRRANRRGAAHVDRSPDDDRGARI